MAFLNLKVLRKKKVDSRTNLTISTNLTNDKTFVEFATTCGRLRLEKSFPCNALGDRHQQAFLAKIRSEDDLYSYFGLKKEA